MEGENRPFSEIFREAADDWCDKEHAAQVLEDTKSIVMAQRQTELGDIPVNRAEQIVKASKSWEAHVLSIVEARRLANKAKMNLEVIRMRANEQNNKEANNRAEMRLT